MQGTKEEGVTDTKHEEERCREGVLAPFLEEELRGGVGTAAPVQGRWKGLLWERVADHR